MSKSWLNATAALAILLGVGSMPVVGIAYADEASPGGCPAGARIDGSTAAEAQKKIAAAGYTQVSQLKKGCDNFWHGRAVKDGVATGVVLTPDGQVLSESLL